MSDYQNGNDAIPANSLNEACNTSQPAFLTEALYTWCHYWWPKLYHYKVTVVVRKLSAEFRLAIQKLFCNKQNSLAFQAVQHIHLKSNSGWRPTGILQSDPNSTQKLSATTKCIYASRIQFCICKCQYLVQSVGRKSESNPSLTVAFYPYNYVLMFMGMMIHRHELTSCGARFFALLYHIFLLFVRARWPPNEADAQGASVLES